MTIYEALDDTCYSLEQLLERGSMKGTGPGRVIRAEVSRIRVIMGELPVDVAGKVVELVKGKEAIDAATH